MSGGPVLYNPSLGNLLLDVVVTNQSNVDSSTGGSLDSDDTGAFTSRAYQIPSAS